MTWRETSAELKRLMAAEFQRGHDENENCASLALELGDEAAAAEFRAVCSLQRSMINALTSQATELEANHPAPVLPMTMTTRSVRARA